MNMLVYRVVRSIQHLFEYLKERLFDKLQPTVRKYYLNENYEGYEQLLKGVGMIAHRNR